MRRGTCYRNCRLSYRRLTLLGRIFCGLSRHFGHLYFLHGFYISEGLIQQKAEDYQENNDCGCPKLPAPFSCLLRFFLSGRLVHQTVKCLLPSFSLCRLLCRCLVLHLSTRLILYFFRCFRLSLLCLAALRLRCTFWHSIGLQSFKQFFQAHLLCVGLTSLFYSHFHSRFRLFILLTNFLHTFGRGNKHIYSGERILRLFNVCRFGHLNQFFHRLFRLHGRGIFSPIFSLIFFNNSRNLLHFRRISNGRNSRDRCSLILHRLPVQELHHSILWGESHLFISRNDDSLPIRHVHTLATSHRHQLKDTEAFHLDRILSGHQRVGNCVEKSLGKSVRRFLRHIGFLNNQISDILE